MNTPNAEEIRDCSVLKTPDELTYGVQYAKYYVSIRRGWRFGSNVSHIKSVVERLLLNQLVDSDVGAGTKHQHQTIWKDPSGSVLFSDGIQTNQPDLAEQFFPPFTLNAKTKEPCEVVIS